MKAGEERFAIGRAHAADIELGLGEVGHDVTRGTAAADIADVDENTGELGRDLGGSEQGFGEREECVAAGARDLRGVGGATAARGGEAARALAGLHDVAGRTRGLKPGRERVTRGGFDEERGTAGRTGFLVGREEDFPDQRGGAEGLLEGLARGEENDESALHFGDPGAAERLAAGHGVVRELPARVRGRAQAPGAGGTRRDRSRRDQSRRGGRTASQRGEATGKRRRGCLSEGTVG